MCENIILCNDKSWHCHLGKCLCHWGRKHPGHFVYLYEILWAQSIAEQAKFILFINKRLLTTCLVEYSWGLFFWPGIVLNSGSQQVDWDPKVGRRTTFSGLETLKYMIANSFDSFNSRPYDQHE